MPLPSYAVQTRTFLLLLNIFWDMLHSRNSNCICRWKYKWGRHWSFGSLQKISSSHSFHHPKNAGSFPVMNGWWFPSTWSDSINDGPNCGGVYSAYMDRCKDGYRFELHGVYSQLVTCIVCEAGKSTKTVLLEGSLDWTESQTCDNCILGKFSTAGTLCTSCPCGKFSTAGGMSSCSSCTAGTYSSSTEKFSH